MFKDDNYEIELISNKFTLSELEMVKNHNFAPCFSEYK